MLSNTGVVVLPQPRQTVLDGLAFYKARPDKGYSLTDSAGLASVISIPATGRTPNWRSTSTWL